MRVVKLYTIGFTQRTAANFFATLREAEVNTVLDTRVHRDGQLSGFAKVPDLPYFLSELAGSGYKAAPILAPTAPLLKAYRNKELPWDEYAQSYLQLLDERKPERELDPADLDRACLLCSERAPRKCHRRLAAEYLQRAFAPSQHIEIVHLE